MCPSPSALESDFDRQEHEVFPAPNAAVLAEVAGADAIIYAMGSLYTSICPSLVLQVLTLDANISLVSEIPAPVCHLKLDLFEALAALAVVS